MRTIRGGRSIPGPCIRRSGLSGLTNTVQPELDLRSTGSAGADCVSAAQSGSIGRGSEDQRTAGCIDGQRGNAAVCAVAIAVSHNDLIKPGNSGVEAGCYRRSNEKAIMIPSVRECPRTGGDDGEGRGLEVGDGLVGEVGSDEGTRGLNYLAKGFTYGLIIV